MLRALPAWSILLYLLPALATADGAIPPAFHQWSDRLHGRICENFLKPEAGPPPGAPALEPRPAPVIDLREVPEFLRSEELATDGPIWQRWMSREPGQTSASYYLINARRALMAFDTWFRTGNPEDFRATLDRLHYVSAVGERGAQPYATLQSGTHYSSGDYFPGLNRSDAHALGPMNFAGHLVRRDHPSFVLHRLAERNFIAQAEWIVTQPLTFELKIALDRTALRQAADSYLPRATVTLTRKKRNYLLPLEIRRGASAKDTRLVWRTRIAGLAEEAGNEKGLPQNQIHRGKMIHTAPQADHVLPYLKLGQRHLELVKALLLESPRNEKHIFEALADYYHVLLNAHVYFRINNSLLMSQVNYVLRLTGNRPVPHADLDYWANALDTQEFRKLFQDHVSDYQK